MKLYQLTQTYTEILDMDLEGTDLDTVLDSLEGTVAEKAEGILMVMKTLEAEQDAYKKEIDRLAALTNKSKNKADSMKKYLSNNLKVMDIKKLDTRLFKISFRKSSSVIIDDITKIPETYIKTVKTVSADKAAIKKMLKTETIEGCHLENKSSMQIK